MIFEVVSVGEKAAKLLDRFRWGDEESEEEDKDTLREGGVDSLSLTPLPATPSAPRTQAERPNTSHQHQRAHTLMDVPRHGFRSEPDLLASTKPKHTRSTSERLLMSTERPPLPSSPPLRRDSLVPPPRPSTPKLLRSLTNRAKQAFSGRSRVNSNADVPPTPPLPPHAIHV